MKGREKCHELIHLIFLTKYPSTILLKNSDGSNVQRNRGWKFFYILLSLINLKLHW